MKKITALLLAVIMLMLPAFPLSAEEAEPLSQWSFYAGKYSAVTNLVMSRSGSLGFAYAENENGGISVTAAPYEVFAARHPTSLLVLNDALEADGLNVTFHSDDFLFSKKNAYESSVYFAWTSSPVDSIPLTTPQAVETGLVGYPEGSDGVYLTWNHPDKDSGATETKNLHLTVSEAGVNSTWDFYGDEYLIDTAKGVEVAFAADDALGYVISVNGVALVGANAPIDLSGFVGEKGHAAVGFTGGYQKSCPADFTLDTVNGEPAAQFGLKPECEHVAGGWSVLNKPTCETEGIRIKKCTLCGEEVERQIVAKLSHRKTTRVITLREPTCNVPGLYGYECMLCKQPVEPFEEGYAAHTPGEWEIDVAPTCQSTGTRRKYCTVCGAGVQVSSVAKLEHTVGDWQYPAGSSCEDKDRIFYAACTVCGDTSVTKTVEASAHDTASEWITVIPATVDSVGLEVKKCVNCDTRIKERELAKLEPSDSFTDVDSDAWYSHAVSYNYASGFFAGVSDSEFDPSGAMTRAMFVTVVGAMCGVTGDDFSDSAFNDVPAGKWYTSYVSWACDNGIVSGIGNDMFAPGDLVTREQAACILYKLSAYLGIEASPDEKVLAIFSDFGIISSWACEGMAWAVEEGLFVGFNGYLDPKGTAERSQVAQIMMNYNNNIYLPSLETGVTYVAGNRQLMMDATIIDETLTTAETEVHDAVKRESVFDFDAEWEEGDAVYHNIVKMPDGTYRMYYKATADRRRICYIESTDGLTWTRPLFSTYLYDGAMSNIVTDDLSNPDNLFVFYDENPRCPENERIKGVYGQWGYGLYLEYDRTNNGQYFKFWPEEMQLMGYPTQTGGCFFDSLNTIYWDAERGKYVAFVRGFHEGDNYNLVSGYVAENPTRITRDIRYSESIDLVNWTTPVPLKYSDGYDFQMYANCIVPYYRDTDLYIGMPTRYIYPEGQTLPITDTMLICSTDLVNWTRYTEAFLTPGSSTETNWVYGDCYPCVGLLETPAATPGADPELSFFMKEKNESTDRISLYRYTMRLDGFVSLNGSYEGDRVVTQPMTFKGEEMTINFRSSSVGKVRVTITDEHGNSIQSGWMRGDDTDQRVSFSGGSVSKFQSKTVRVTFELVDAEIYSFNFD